VWKTVVYSGALLIALVVIGALNYQTPSGSVSIQGAVVDITPNVSGTVTEVAIVPHTDIKKARFCSVSTTRHMLQRSPGSKQCWFLHVRQRHNWQTDLDAVGAEIAGLNSQLDFGRQRRDDIDQLADRGASTGFQMQEAVSTIDQLEAGLIAARARKAALKCVLHPGSMALIQASSRLSKCWYGPGGIWSKRLFTRPGTVL
jgi:multidrug resistance efflux pump